MRTPSLMDLGDRDLVSLLHDLAAKERVSTADLVACIAEVDRRRLYAPAGYASMFTYCVGKFGLSEDAAYRRIQAARVAQRCSAVLPALRDGRLHLTGVILLDRYLTAENAAELLLAASGKSKSEIEELLAQRFPGSEELPMVMALPTVRSVTGRELAPERVHVGNPTPAAEASLPAKIAPVAQERYALHLTFGKGTRDKLDYARALLGHRIPYGDLEQVLDRVLDLAIAQLEKGKFAATDRPRRSTRTSTNPRSIPAHVKRAVRERDQRCTFVGDDGHRCGERTRLEYDHVDPVARGGRATVENLRLRCRLHNQLEAERTFGAGFMERKREQARHAAEAGAAHPSDAEGAGGDQEVRARAIAEEQARDVYDGLRNLGCRAERAQRAVEHCMALPECSLEERMRVALSSLRPRTRVQGGATALG